VEDPTRSRLRIMLGELLDHMEGAQEVASGIAREYPEYEAMAEAVSNAMEMVAMARELEAHGQREDCLTDKYSLQRPFPGARKRPSQVREHLWDLLGCCRRE
jgi:hypothetical protein